MFGRSSERGIAVMAFGLEVIETRTGAHISLHPQEADGGQAPFKTKLAGCSLNDIVGTAVLALVAWTSVFHAQTGDAAAQTAPVQQQQSAPPDATAPADDGLSDLNAVTFRCVRAGLNAAGRAGAQRHAQGTLSFPLFTITQ